MSRYRLVAAAIIPILVLTACQAASPTPLPSSAAPSVEASPSTSASCYASIHTGVPPQEHGVLSNDTLFRVGRPDIFSEVTKAGGRTERSGMLTPRCRSQPAARSALIALTSEGRAPAGVPTMTHRLKATQ